MEINEILKKHEQEENWLSKISDFFKYTIWDNTQMFFYNVQWFFHNLKVFRKTLWKWRDWDHEYTKDLYVVCLKEIAKAIKNGVEEDRSANKKVNKINELIQLLETDIEEITYKEIKEGRKNGVKEENLLQEMRKKQEEHKNKILNIIKGQDNEDFQKKYDEIANEMKKQHPEKEIDSYEVWVQTFDGSGVEYWWD